MKKLYWDEHGVGRCPTCDYDARFTSNERAEQYKEFGSWTWEHMCERCWETCEVDVGE